MYRRNISHILGPITAVLFFVVLYHEILKPKFFPNQPAPPPKVVESTPPPPPAPSANPQREALAEPRRPRTIDPTTIPISKDIETLDAIRTEIEKGHAAEARAKLADLPSTMLSDQKTRRYLAVLWNNLGILQERTGGTEASVDALKTATLLDPTNAVAHLNLAHAYWGLRDPALTEEFVKKIIKLAPDEPFPHLALADILQDQDNLTEAARHLEQAAERAEKDPSLQSYLQAVTAKVKRAGQVEDQLTSRGSSHFTVKFNGAEDYSTWTAVLDILEEAYRDIGQKFNHFPSKPIIVVLHTKDTFHGMTGSPIWADGLFDPVLGRIQIPTQGALTDRVWLTRVLRHEYVHAVLHDLLGVNSGAMPQWLNEGLAMQLAGDPWPDLENVMQGEVQLIPLTALEGGWGNLSSEAATVAYTEANSATHYMIERFGMNKIHELLGLLKTRQALPAAMQDKLFLSYDQFQKQWADNLSAKHQAARS